MKKRMFITTIVMMLVLAVALTTSSLAWFSSAQTSVTANAATFRATSAGSSNVNLKISDTTDTWRNSINLTGGEGRTMLGMVPVNALIPIANETDDGYTFPETTGVTINGADVEVTHANLKWAPRMTFNAAKIGDESNFIIEADANGNLADGTTEGTLANKRNKVDNYGGNADGSSSGYYYEEFYIHNADTQSPINSLKFEVHANHRTIYQNDSNETGAEQSDYTCEGYVAFIIFDAVEVAIGEVVPDNALDGAGKTVVASDATASSTQINASATTDVYLAWVPFGAFSYAIDNGIANEDVDPWQYADLDEVVTGNFRYNNAQINTLSTQAYDALTGTTGYVLNNANLANLNNKVKDGNTGNVSATGSASNDDGSINFVMPAGETFKVSMYFWYDGYTMTAFTDTTMTTIDVKISASQTQLGE